MYLSNTIPGIHVKPYKLAVPSVAGASLLTRDSKHRNKSLTTYCKEALH
jgi:hypothetical protein